MKPLMAANWKMNKDSKEAVSFINDFKEYVKGTEDAEILICPSFTLLSEAKKHLGKTKIKLGAQNMHYEEKGAFTGEISALMLKDTGCEYVILGHSERRSIFGESNELVNKKLKTALNKGLRPIVCIGEVLEEREKGITNEVIKNQIEGSLDGISSDDMRKI
ncbi:triose-phosphate isomerase, partial [Candidatus Woesearchaeota archaeon]|nr:triose-phosphate isomerase [Candidatus Woesearchaeota archaeon]